MNTTSLNIMKLSSWILIVTILGSCTRGATAPDASFEDEEALLKRYLATAKRSVQARGATSGEATPVGHTVSEEAIYGILLFGNNESQAPKPCAKWNLLLHGAELLIPLRAETKDSIKTSGTGKIYTSTTTTSRVDGFVFKIPIANGDIPDISLSGIVRHCEDQRNESAWMPFQEQNASLEIPNGRVRFKKTYLSETVAIRGLIVRGTFPTLNNSNGSPCTVRTVATPVTLGENVDFEIRSSSSPRIVSTRKIYLFEDTSEFRLARDSYPMRGKEVNQLPSESTITATWSFNTNEGSANREARHIAEHPGGMLMIFRVADGESAETECSATIRFKPFSLSE